MTDNKNMKINDEAMAQASGGKLEPGDEKAVIKGIVMVDPYPTGISYSGMFDECQRNGYQVYELADGRFAVADRHLPDYDTGDEVIVSMIRGCYGWEIVSHVTR